VKRKLDLDPVVLRRGAYPPPTDQLDAIWKMLGVLLADAAPKTRAKLDPAAIEMAEQVGEVKVRFPKPAALPVKGKTE
jgi:hypothetical protein